VKGLATSGNPTPLLLEGQTLEESLFAYLFIAGVSIVFLLSVIVFLSLATRYRAGVIASRMTEELFSSRELFLELYRSSPLPYMLIDYEGAITFPNTASVRLFGITERELEGKNIFKLLESDGEQEHLALLPVRFQQGTPIHDEEVRITSAEGAHRWALLSVFPFGRENGEHKGLVTLVDITRRKEVERAKTEFVSLASHELRTPVASLRWNAELLRSERFGTLSPEQQDVLDKLGRNIDRMNALIDDFLNASRLELGTLVSDPKPLVLSELVDEIIETQASVIDKKRLVLKRDYDEALGTITSDRRLLYLVIGNLVSNAVKYTPEAGVATVSFRASGDKVKITVSDTGVGIPRDEQDRIFTKLFRASNVREQIPSGIGLGLYITRLALKILQGTIEFTSEVGKGTVFTVVLPR